MNRLLRVGLCAVLAVSAAFGQSFPVKVNASGVLTEPTNFVVPLGGSLSGVVPGANGGTGTANTGKTITLGGNVTTSGAFGLTLTLTGTTGVTLPTTGTLATLAGTETLTNKTLSLGSNTLTATSAQLATALSDATGTGAVVFSSSPTFTGTPILSTTATATAITGPATTNLTLTGGSAGAGITLGQGVNGNTTISAMGGRIIIDYVAAPGAPTVTLDATSGNLSGTYTYRVTYTNANGETALGTLSSTVSPANQRVNLTSIPVSSNGSVTKRKIYRNKAVDAGVWYLLATINDNTTTTYADNAADAALLLDAHFLIGSTRTAPGIYIGDELFISETGLNERIGRGAGYQMEVLGTSAGGAYNNFLAASYCFSSFKTGAGNVAVGPQIGYGASLPDGISDDTYMGVKTAYENTGSRNSGFGAYSLGKPTNNSVGLGYTAGKYDDVDYMLYIDAIDRGNKATGRTNSLLYGGFNASPASQFLTVNGALTSSISIAGPTVAATTSMTTPALTVSGIATTRIPYATTGGLFTSDPLFTYAGSTLSVGAITTTNVITSAGKITAQNGRIDIGTTSDNNNRIITFIRPSGAGTSTILFDGNLTDRNGIFSGVNGSGGTGNRLDIKSPNGSGEVRIYTGDGVTLGSTFTSTQGLTVVGNVTVNGGTVTNGTPKWVSGAGTPEGNVTAPAGSIYTRTDGGAATCFYVKESGSGNTGWIAK